MNLEPGRELDAMVATRVMGLRQKTIAIPGHPGGPGGSLSDHSLMGVTLWFGPGADGIMLPAYSTSIADAWMVVGKLSDRLQCHIQSPEPGAEEGYPSLYGACFRERWGDFDYEFAPTAPLAISIAALKAMGVEC